MNRDHDRPLADHVGDACTLAPSRRTLRLGKTKLQWSIGLTSGTKFERPGKCPNGIDHLKPRRFANFASHQLVFQADPFPHQPQTAESRRPALPGYGDKHLSTNAGRLDQSEAGRRKTEKSPGPR